MAIYFQNRFRIIEKDGPKFIILRPKGNWKAKGNSIVYEYESHNN